MCTGDYTVANDTEDYFCLVVGDVSYFIRIIFFDVLTISNKGCPCCALPLCSLPLTHINMRTPTLTCLPADVLSKKKEKLKMPGDTHIFRHTHTNHNT